MPEDTVRTYSSSGILLIIESCKKRALFGRGPQCLSRYELGDVLSLNLNFFKSNRTLIFPFYNPVAFHINKKMTIITLS